MSKRKDIEAIISSTSTATTASTLNNNHNNDNAYKFRRTTITSTPTHHTFVGGGGQQQQAGSRHYTKNILDFVSHHYQLLLNSPDRDLSTSFNSTINDNNTAGIPSVPQSPRGESLYSFNQTTMTTMGIDTHVVRWLLRLIECAHVNLSGILDHKDIGKILKKLIIYLIGSNEYGYLHNHQPPPQQPKQPQQPPTPQTPMSLRSLTIVKTPISSIPPSPRLLHQHHHQQQQGQGQQTPYSPFRGHVDRLSEQDDWCPYRSRLVSIRNLSSRRANYASLDQSMPEEDSHMFRLLIGKITHSSDPRHKDRLVIRDQGGEVPLQLSAKCTDTVYLMDAIVFVSSWRLVIVNNKQEEGSQLTVKIEGSDTTTANATQSHIGNYLEVEKMHVLYRSESHYYQRCYNNYESGVHHDISTFQQYLLKTFPLAPSASISNLNLNSFNIAGRVLTKTSILHAKLPHSSDIHKYFILRVELQTHTGATQRPSFILFSGEQTKWFQLLDVGHSYLFTGVGALRLVRQSGTGPKQTMYEAKHESQYFVINTLHQTRPAYLANQIQQGGVHPLPSTIDYIGTITADFSSNRGYYLLDDEYRLFITHYRCSGFYGSGLRLGTMIKLENVHTVYVNKQFKGFGMCTSSSIKFISFEINQRLRNFQPYQSTELSALCDKYSIIDSFILPKLFDRLVVKFPKIFTDAKSTLTKYKDIMLYEQIAEAFDIKQVERLDDYESIVRHHAGRCQVSNQYARFPIIIEISQIMKPTIMKSECYWAGEKYTLISRFELEPQNYEWGKVYIKDNNCSSFLVCHIPDLNEFHLQYIWKVNKFLIVLERYTDEDKQAQTFSYIQFSMDDCSLVAPLVFDRFTTDTLIKETHFFQEQFNVFQQLLMDSPNSLSSADQHQHGMFFKLLCKIIRLGRMSLSVVLLLPNAPNVKIFDVPSAYFPILQTNHCYYIDHCTIQPTNSRTFQSKIIVTPNVQIRSIVLCDATDETRLCPEYGHESISKYNIPMVKVQSKELFDSFYYCMPTVTLYNINELMDVELGDEPNSDNSVYNYVSFRGIVTHHSVLSINGKLSLKIRCRDQAMVDGKDIEVNLNDYFFGLVKGLVVDFNNMSLVSGENGNTCHSNKYSHFTVVQYATSKGKEHRSLDGAGVGIGGDQELAVKATLSQINRQSDPATLYRVVADVTSIINMELAYYCNVCDKALVSSDGCQCLLDNAADEVIFKGRLECRISDGSNTKTMLVQDEANIAKILSIGPKRMKRLRSQLVDDRKVGVWSRSDKMDLDHLNGWDVANLRHYRGYNIPMEQEWRTFEMTLQKHASDTQGFTLQCHHLSDSTSSSSTSTHTGGVTITPTTTSMTNNSKLSFSLDLNFSNGAAFKPNNNNKAKTPLRGRRVNQPIANNKTGSTPTSQLSKSYLSDFLSQPFNM
ncbi:hypothetical protein SAMD00019534_074260 [Acytostelium subglobosum LB1]|uniref:hypothetical protein n=1 Tax=Acytostelium subglobosum LB1 TaxID=1410327 RepID=UPI0006451375|nr:hypothetical protein SAMD00019534_074260 [Acytostelium subglobosum LB1]GAM24251.1 hypothetical protein SAMD00019534_074260 [Acytostelium subglobosum LB1]|eukprot:XP_012752577.1 hypothetical protein SAMD00019534_074260 [Acytostelium subglobosum LB1]